MRLSGFGNFHQSETELGLLPQDQNSPQQCIKGLYPEQISGSAFTRLRHQNLRTWVYRRLPSVAHHDFEFYSDHLSINQYAKLPPNPLRWSAWPTTEKSADFIDGLIPIAQTLTNTAFLYQCQRSMENRYFNNQDGEFLLIPYEGTLQVVTELGILKISPGEILLLPRGIYFKIILEEKCARGYLCENRGNPLSLPQLGPIGANGLANPRHFLYPQAAYENSIKNEACLINKFQHSLWISKNNPTPMNVAAWQGNYAPCTYDLSLFNTINTVSFDHPDPSIFTVLTSESEIPGVANLDFVIFPPRWMVAEHTFRPPYFHRNIMSEFMGLIQGQYDAKAEGFMPGGISIHNAMCPHGPDVHSTEQAQNNALQPHFFSGGLAFMLESKDIWQVSETAYEHPCRQRNYTNCWQGFEAAAL